MSFGQESLRFWYCKIRDLRIPQPKTIIIPVKDDSLRYFAFIKRDLPALILEKLTAGATSLGFPLFLRTDITSYKQAWDRTCYVSTEEALLENARRIVSYSLLVEQQNMKTTAIVLREYIPLDVGFSAFSGSLPIAAERRFFVLKGEVLCHHPYWTETVILNPNKPDWRMRLIQLNKISSNEVKLLSKYASQIAQKISGGWSVDFVRTNAKKWILIDMAPIEKSSLPDPSCDRCTKEKGIA